MQSTRIFSKSKPFTGLAKRFQRPYSEKTQNPGKESLASLQNKLQDLKQELKNVENQIVQYQQQDGSQKRILFLGAGLSAGPGLRYLLGNAEKENWSVRVGDANVALAQEKVGNHLFGSAFKFDVNDDEQRAREVKEADIVVSLLPAVLHVKVAKEALKHKKNLLTASYISDEMRSLHDEATKSGVLFLNEIGLDPGIDHMACMQVAHGIIAQGGDIRAIESFCGGLVAPESDNNPWGYKFSWNPRNVVLAGQGGCKFVQMGQYKYIPYHRLFSRIENLSLYDDDGNKLELEGYANRDSIKYRTLYNMDHIPTFFRGSLRKQGFSKAWDIFVQLGLTDDTYVMEDSEHMTYRQFINSALMYRKSDSVELKLCYHLGLSIDSPEMSKLRWLGIFEDTKIGLKRATPAQILQQLLERKWRMSPDDRDMIVMYNKFIYNDSQGNATQQISTMVVKGENRERTAMGTTVGLPLAVATKLVLKGQIKVVGVHAPIIKEIYDPVLAELETLGIAIKHTKSPYNEGEQ